ncbi:methyltransferase domain-containing protein [Nocardia huaxiensis]|uniref:Methyltransferase domain-containing protein n=1 Tax=Nocardia huaxiensis TaxID=2755382 RepID=A0A7D6V9D6_9NOCA|nr:class I SAM-dependent methyltransferase [Nocardia huaxiensis]QLY30972.1 methyltransferase domain-containing protein [Nocardia huaxiensis]
MSESADVRATRQAYDEMAELYSDFVHRHLESSPFDRAMLDVFADVTRGAGEVLEVGCGPGRIAGYLHAAGLRISGLDLSPEMIRIARIALPHLSFEVGNLERLDRPDASLAGIVAWYSLIHTPPARIPAVLSEFARVLRPGAHLLLGFQAPAAGPSGQSYDHKVATSYLWTPDAMSEALAGNGFRATATLSREARPDERTPQGYVLAVRL